MEEIFNNISDEELKSIFELFDTDNSGRITSEELLEGMKTLGVEISSTEIFELMHVLDEDGDNYIEFHEFRTLMNGNLKEKMSKLKKINDSLEKELTEIFNQIDKEGNKTISHQQFIIAVRERNLFGKEVNEEYVLDWLKRNDLDGDGNLSLEEFIRMMSISDTIKKKSSISEEDEKEILKVFSLFDSNKDNKVDLEEFTKSLHKLGINPTSGEVLFLFSEWDPQSTGFLDFQTFSKMLYSFI
eukprot:TRINITY_DN1460_c0_g1_i1.p1 TRINITY_DN1460_c0_g1~~TRINITY_DN1460_c0_g1_i1.p1  ORF type:complete len:243 (-),score=71.72 TRINITY_DN1460_c0_g1_i1:53-781(-)